MPEIQRSAVVLGARTLGWAIIDRLQADGWRVTGVARSAETVAAIEARGALAIRADAADLTELADALALAERTHGGLDLIINAINPSRPPNDSPFGGGAIAEADLAAVRGWTHAVAEQAFVFLRTGIAALRANGGGTLIQITGGSSRRAKPGAGLWAAGTAAARAMLHAAVHELRDEPVHPKLLIVDSTIGPEPAEWAEIADAAVAMAEPRGYRLSHEVHLVRPDLPWSP